MLLTDKSASNINKEPTMYYWRKYSANNVNAHAFALLRDISPTVIV
jgi:hypothetical protein